MFSLGLSEPSPLRITEIVADNRGGLRDEGGGSPDYIEIRNTSDQAQSLDGLSVAHSLRSDAEDVFTFPVGTMLDPGEYIIVFADANLDQGELHAPFRIDTTSDRVMIFRIASDGSRRYIDGIDTGFLGRNEAVVRAPGSGDIWLIDEPSPYGDSIGGDRVGFGFNGGGDRVVYHTFTTEPGSIYTPEISDSLAPGSWQSLPAIIGDGSVKTASRDLSGEIGFVRIRRTTAP
jgi:hypothetical protein